MLSTRDWCQILRHTQTESEGIEKITCKRNDKKFGVAELKKLNRLWNKDYKKRQRRALHNVKGVQQEDVTLVNIYAPSIVAHKYRKQILTCKRRNWQ